MRVRASRCSSVARKSRRSTAPVGEQQELGERELALAEDAERRGHRLALVALADHGRGERVVAGLAVGPEVDDARHHEREERREQLLQQVADEEVLLARLADDRRRVDRVLAAGRAPSTSEHRVVVAQRVVAVVVAERPFRPAQPRRHVADERDLGVGDERVRRRARRSGRACAPAMSDASISSGTFSGSGAIAASISAGGPPRKTVTGSASPRASAAA